MILAPILLLSISAVHAVPHPASPEDEGKIAAAIESARELVEGELRDAQERIIAIEKKWGRRDAKGRVSPYALPLPHYLAKAKKDVLYEYGTAVQQAGHARRMVSDRLTVAINLALRAYGISEPGNPPSGPIVSGPPNQPNKPGALKSHLGKWVSFDPRLTFSLLDGSDALGHTAHDGAVRIEMEAFDYPGKLGMTLYHESLHFKELLTPGVDILNEPRNETRQRRDEHLLWRRVFGLRQADIKRRERKRRQYASKMAQWDQMVAEGFDPTTEDGYSALKGMLNTVVRPEEDPSFPREMKPGLDDILGKADELEAAVEAETRARRIREAEAARERQERERLEDGRRLFASLKAFSHRFCESAVNGVVPEGMYDEFLQWRNGNYLAFSTEQPVVDLGDLGFATECPAFFENQILVARRKRYNHDVVTFDWAAQVVREAYRRTHPTIPTWPPESSPARPPVGPPTQTYPDDAVPPIPTVPHCRYHAWCKG